MPDPAPDPLSVLDPGPESGRGTLPPSVIPEPDPRVVLAAERTLLSWMRTGLALMGFGFVVARFGWFLREVAAIGQREADALSSEASLWIGTGLVGMGIWVLVGSTLRYRRYLRSLYRGDLTLPGPAMGTNVALVLALLGLVMVAYLVTVGLLG
jgi:putative membrane protein